MGTRSPTPSKFSRSLSPFSSRSKYLLFPLSLCASVVSAWIEAEWPPSLAQISWFLFDLLFAFIVRSVIRDSVLKQSRELSSSFVPACEVKIFFLMIWFVIWWRIRNPGYAAFASFFFSGAMNQHSALG
ncbi:hypothetical protein MUK42_35060 [Musa troglodytarum]|uniref:Uncharacterized protein n=1 Tax=Musa troglodytarum TaxID=320322 RepID=A0A9E7JZB4_9LILI|nr:hypothetical protein MUK42_35060 [Musa troglodytarum]